MTNKAIEELLDLWFEAKIKLAGYAGTSAITFFPDLYKLEGEFYSVYSGGVPQVAIPVTATTYQNRIEWQREDVWYVLSPAPLPKPTFDNKNYPIAGHTYTHYKGGKYKVKEIAFSKIDGYDGHAVVVYTSEKDGSVYVRTVEDWLSPVSIPKANGLIPRFKLEE